MRTINENKQPQAQAAQATLAAGSQLKYPLKSGSRKVADSNDRVYSR